LLRRGFHVCSLHEALRISSRGGALRERAFIITFDDGFQSVHTHAWPFLRDHGLPFTIFVNTAYLDGGGPFPFDAWAARHRDRLPPESYRPLTLEQCREMAATRLARFGAHTHTHADFRDRPEPFEADLQLSVDLVREWFGEPLVTFAFPVGSPSRGFAGGALAGAARRTGVACALTTESVLVDPAMDPFHWGRFTAFPWDTATTLAAKLDGWYSWAPKARHRIGSVARAVLANVVHRAT
jgi:peptidoglycan/xylan/chitin deacetylase (PgdA/CDA1 family)